MKHTDFPKKAGEILLTRGAVRDKIVTGTPERSITHIVRIYNAITGQQMTEDQAHTFMQSIKLARMERATRFDSDDYIDLIGYTSLKGEARFNSQMGITNGTSEPDTNAAAANAASPASASGSEVPGSSAGDARSNSANP